MHEVLPLFKLAFILEVNGFALFLHARADTIEGAQHVFWKQADFGYVEERMNEVKIHCKPETVVSISVYIQNKLFSDSTPRVRSSNNLESHFYIFTNLGVLCSH